MKSKRRLLVGYGVLLVLQLALVCCAFIPNYRTWASETRPAHAAARLHDSIRTAGIVMFVLLVQSIAAAYFIRVQRIVALAKWAFVAAFGAILLTALAGARWHGFGIALRWIASTVVLGGRMEFRGRVHNAPRSVPYQWFDIHLQTAGSAFWEYGWRDWANLWAQDALLPRFTYDGLNAVLSLPFIWLLPLTGLPMLLLWRMDRVRKPGCCVSCSYDLTGNTSGRCPECGREA